MPTQQNFQFCWGPGRGCETNLLVGKADTLILSLCHFVTASKSEPCHYFYLTFPYFWFIMQPQIPKDCHRKILAAACGGNINRRSLALDEGIFAWSFAEDKGVMACLVKNKW